MVSTKKFSLAGLLWLGLASRGLALEIDQNNELTLAERSELLGEASALDTRTMSIQIVPNPGKHARAVEEIDERDLEELDERDFEELEARNMPGKHRSSWSGQGGSGPRRPRDLEARFGKVGPKARLGLAYTARDYNEELETRNMPGKHRSSWGAQGSGPRRTRDLEERNMPGKHRSSWGGQGSGPRRPRDLEERNMPGKHRSSWAGQGGSGPRRSR